MEKDHVCVSVSVICVRIIFYPHIKASWGGGTPVPVTIYFSKDSPVMSNQSASVQLLDESDNGFYIVSRKDSKAVFIPRTAVSFLYFGKKPPASFPISSNPSPR